VFGGLSPLEWAWHLSETNLRCARISGICMPNPSIIALKVFEISAFIRTDGQGWIDSANDPDQEYIETLPSTCYKLSDDSSTPFYSTSNGNKTTIK